MYPSKNSLTFISTSASTTIVGITAASQLVDVHTIYFPKTTTGTVRLYRTDGTSYGTYPIGSIGCHILDATLGKGLIVSTSAADTVILSWYQ